jgi:hypothetical protein
MGSVEAFSFSHSAGGIGDLVLPVALLFVNFFAVAKIISKAGFSKTWILVPLAPVGLWFVTVILLAVDVKSAVVGDTTVSLPVHLANFQILEVLDFLSIVVTWVFFMIFAFARWPVSTAPRPDGMLASHSPSAYLGKPQNPAQAAAPAAAPTGRRGRKSPPASPPPPAAPAMPAPGVFVPPGPRPDIGGTVFCSWCGKERAFDAHAIHHCGSRERPSVYCMACGTLLAEGADDCASCGTPALKLSPK